MIEKRVFATTYDPQQAMPRLWIPLIGAAIMGIIGLYLDLIVLTLFSAIATALAVRNWAYSTPARVVLRLDDHGVDIDGIGRLPWSEVTRAGFLELPVPQIAPRFIRIDLNGPLEMTRRAAAAFERPQWQKTLGRQMGPNAVIIPVTGLLDSPEDIASAFEHFLKDRFFRMTPGFSNDNMV